MNKTSLVVLISFVVLFSLSHSASAQDWFNESYQFRKNITITNNDPSIASPIGMVANATIDTSNVTLFGSSCSLLILVDNSTGTQIQIDREVSPEISETCGTTQTLVYFNVTSSIPAASSTTDYLFYYGNSSEVESPLSNGSKVFPFFDDFEDYTDGDLNNQGLWAGSVEFDVISNDSISGSKSVRLVSGTDVDIKTSTLPQFLIGRLIFFVKDGLTAPGKEGGLQIFEDASRKMYQHLLNDGGSFVWNIGGTSTGTFASGDWTKGEGKWRTDDSYVAFGNNSFLLNRTQLLGGTTNGINIIALGIGGGFVSGDVIKYDYVAYSEWMDIEPSFSTGSQQQLAVNDTPPTFSNNQTNSTTAGTTILHSLLWADDLGLDSFIFSFDNGVASFTNDSAVAFGGTGWSNVSKTVTSTIGATIRWQVFANDTGGNLVASDIYQYTTTGTGNPTITIFSPTNTTFTILPIALEVGADQIIDVWQFQLDGGANQTFVPNTTISPANGVHELTVFGNNSLGEVGSATVFFTPDVLLSVTIVSPTATDFTSIPISLEVITSGTADGFLFNLDSVGNVSFTPNTTISPINGGHTIEVFANNSAGIIVSDSVSFTVNAPIQLDAASASAFAVIIIVFIVGLIIFITQTLRIEKTITVQRLLQIFVITIIGIAIVGVLANVF